MSRETVELESCENDIGLTYVTSQPRTVHLRVTLKIVFVFKFEISLNGTPTYSSSSKLFQIFLIDVIKLKFSLLRNLSQGVQVDRAVRTLFIKPTSMKYVEGLNNGPKNLGTDSFCN